MANVFEIENHLQEAGVFISGISGKTADMYAYMTIINFEKLVEISPSLKKAFSQEDWKTACDYWEHSRTLSPVVRLLLSWVKSTFLVD